MYLSYVDKYGGSSPKNLASSSSVMLRMRSALVATFVSLPVLRFHASLAFYAPKPMRKCSFTAAALTNIMLCICYAVYIPI